MDSTKASDCAAIIKAFEKHLLSSPSEGAILGATLPKVASISSNATAASNQLKALTNPPVPEELLSTFGNTPEQNGNLVEIPQVNNLVDVNAWKDWLEKCIPCSARLEFRTDLVDGLDDDFIDMLFQMANLFLKELSFLINLLNASDVYADICPILFAMQDICIPDLQRILSLLASIVYRMSVRDMQSLDLMKLLIMPIFQPIFSGLVGMLNQYKLLVTNPLTCVVGNINTQIGKFKTSGVINEDLILNLTDKTEALGLISGKAQKQSLQSELSAARQPFVDIDSGITAMQTGLGTSLVHLERLMTVGIVEIEALLFEYKRELSAFLGVEGKETVEFLLNQYQKLIIFRLISFISALVKANTSGFNCNFDNLSKAEDTVGSFLNDFLGPNSPVIVTNNTTTGDIQLFLDPALAKTLDNAINTGDVSTIRVINPNLPFSSTDSPEVDRAINAIIAQTIKPVTIKPSCVFNTGEVDSNKFAQWIAELEATGV